MLDLTKIKNFDDFIKENQEKQTDGYIISNRGYITASKLKDYMKSPEYFFLKYILEVPVDGEEKKCFTLGTAVDDFITYGEEKFQEKYFLDEGLKKPELEALALSKKIPLEAKETVDSLKQKIYGDISKKIRLTAGDSKKVQKIISEFKRQPLFDWNGEYEKQKTLTGEFKKLKLKGTLDRFKILSEEDNLLKIMIRDTKTTADIIKFKFQAVNELGYDTSMSFYNILAILNYRREKNNPDLKVDTTLTLDVCQTSGNYASRFVKIPPELVKGKIDQTIMGALESLNGHMTIWENKKDPKIWQIEMPLEITKDLDLYSEMVTTLQKEWDWLE